MKLIKPSWAIEDMKSGDEILKSLERFGRNCYKSEDRITSESARRFMQMIVHEKKHYSILRHEKATVRLICSRSTSHQIVRHGLASFLQESQRYVNYSKKNDGEIQFIIPHFLHEFIPEGVYKDADVDKLELLNGVRMWARHMLSSSYMYHSLIELGWKPERARGVLANDAKTEVIITANLEEWRHIFNQRASSHADEAMQHLIYPLLEEFKKHIPILFDDINP